MNALIVPATVMISGQDGPRIATVDRKKRLNFKTVWLGREVEILAGIDPAASLCQRPADAWQGGHKVAVREWQ